MHEGLGEGPGPFAVPGDVIAWALVAPPGGGVITWLSRIVPEQLDASDRVDLLVAWQRQEGWVAAVRLPALVAVSGPAWECDGRDYAGEEVGLALRLPGVTARGELELAKDLLGRLPGTYALLQAGRVSYQHARKVSEACLALTDAQALEVERRVLGRAPEQTVAQLARCVARAVLRVAPGQAEQRRQQAATERSVRLVPLPDGMAMISAFLSAADAVACYQRVQAQTPSRCQDPADDRSADARRADTFLDLLLGRQPTPAQPTPAQPGPGQPGPVEPVRLNLTMSLDTLTGLRADPAQLDGYGPVTAGTARDLIAARGALLRRLVFEPLHGQLIDYGHQVHRLPADLARFITARDQHCVIRGCQRTRCDHDHTLAWNDGGGTDRHNCALLCPRHHHMKHTDGWHLTRQPDGSMTLTTPAGKTYTTKPPSYHPDG